MDLRLVQGEGHLKRQTFITGALILAAGSLISRLMGGVYRFILPWIMGGGEVGAYGMALFGYPYSIYAIALALSASGIPLAISKLVSEQVALGNHRGADRVFRVALALLAVMGIAVALILYLGAGFFSQHVFRNPDTYYSVVAIAPAAFFVSLKAAYRGYFQGLQDMVPTAASQIIEQIGRIATMFVLAILLLPLGIEFAAAGATFGAVTGAVVGLAYLMLAFHRRRRELPAGDAGAAVEPARVIIWRLAALGIPIALTGIVLPLTRLMDAALVPSRLQGIGFSQWQATVLFGYLDSYAMPFINVPTIFTTALAISLVPAVAECVALGDTRGLRLRVEAATRLTIILGLPAAVGLMALSREIPYMMWKAADAGGALFALAPVALFLPLQQITAGIMQGLGRARVPMQNLLLGTVLKLLLTYVLVAVPVLNIAGAAWATVVAFAVASTLNMISVTRSVGSVFSVGPMLVKPGLATLAMAVTVRLSLLAAVPVLGPRFAVLVVVGLGMAVYGLVLVSCGGISRADIEMIPRLGPAAVRGLERLGVIK